MIDFATSNSHRNTHTLLVALGTRGLPFADYSSCVCETFQDHGFTILILSSQSTLKLREPVVHDVQPRSRGARFTWLGD